MLTTEQIQTKQSEYDLAHWKHGASEIENVRHITLHAGKLLGKLSTYCEALEHSANPSSQQIREEVIPDLLVYAAKLANQYGLDLGDSYVSRLKVTATKFE